MSKFNVAITILAFASAQVAVAAEPQAPVPSTKAAPVKEKLVCETEEEIGTRLGGKRVCATAAEWSQRRADQRQHIERAQATGACIRLAGC